MKRMISLACSILMLLSLFNVAYATEAVVEINQPRTQCTHTYTAYSTGTYRYSWYNRTQHKKYEIFQEVCTKCGYNYRQTYAELGTFNHAEGSTYCSGGYHVTPGKHTFYKKCTTCGGECATSITVKCPGDDGYAHVEAP